MAAPPVTPEQVEEVLRILEVMESALAGDGSTVYMPDVTQADAAKWILSALHYHGYAVLKVKG